MSIDQHRIYQPDDIPLVRLQANGASSIGSALINFTLPTPDARILLKTSILFFQEANVPGTVIPFDATLAGNVQWFLSLQAADKVGAGQYVPTANIVGAGRITGSTMQTIPLAIDLSQAVNNLDGFTIDVQGGQDAVIGQFQMLFFGTLAGTKGVTAVLRARWNLIAAEMCQAEWEWARAQMSPVFNADVRIF